MVGSELLRDVAHADLAIVGNRLFMTLLRSDGYGLVELDITDRTDPVYVGRDHEREAAVYLAVHGSQLWLSGIGLESPRHQHLPELRARTAGAARPDAGHAIECLHRGPRLGGQLGRARLTDVYLDTVDPPLAVVATDVAG